MLRATKLFSVLLFAAIAFAGTSQVNADTYTYEMGPYTVTGYGFTDSLAADDAWDQAYDIMASIEASLPENEEIIDLVVESGALIGPGEYRLVFHVVIEGDVPVVPSEEGPGD